MVQCAVQANGSDVASGHAHSADSLIGQPAPVAETTEEIGRYGGTGLDLDRDRNLPLTNDQIDLVPCLIPEEVDT